MRNKIGLAAILLLLSIVIGAFSFKSSILSKTEIKDNMDSTAHPGYKSVTVVELYTSEGCSSCPPAEEIQSHLQDYYSKSNLPVYILAFHVDYWNHLGWEDNYAQAAFNERQRGYQKLFRLQSVYTPQAIVNGRSEVNANDDYTLQKYISDELGEGSYHTLKCAITDSSKSHITLNYEIQGPVKDLFLNIAIVDHKSSIPVKKGENGGKTLLHTNTVLLFESDYIEKKEGTITVKLPFKFNPEKHNIIAYIQNLKTLQITGAQRL